MLSIMALLAFVAHLQEAAMSPVAALALAALTPVVAWISVRLYDGIKSLWPWYDRLPALVHQVAAPLFGFLSGWLTGSLGIAAFTDLHGITPGLIAGVLNLGVMAGIKRYEKSKAVAP